MDSFQTVEAKLDAVLLAIRQQSEVPRFLSVERAATYTSLSPESIRRLLAAGKLTALRPVRGRVLIDRQQLESYVLAADTRTRTGRGRR
jgi:excisionase family DNA binding protein